jgi:hypothetical protein
MSFSPRTEFNLCTERSDARATYQDWWRLGKRRSVARVPVVMLEEDVGAHRLTAMLTLISLSCAHPENSKITFFRLFFQLEKKNRPAYFPCRICPTLRRMRDAKLPTGPRGARLPYTLPARRLGSMFDLNSNNPNIRLWMIDTSAWEFVLVMMSTSEAQE